MADGVTQVDQKHHSNLECGGGNSAGHRNLTKVLVSRSEHVTKKRGSWDQMAKREHGARSRGAGSHPGAWVPNACGNPE